MELHTESTIAHDAALREMIAAGALFVVNHSGGKDSQAMYAVIRSLVPHEQIYVVHADLPGVDWAGLQDHIGSNVDHPVDVVTAIWKDGTKKTLLDMVDRRFEQLGGEVAPWPSSGQRYCTSDLKRGPIEKAIRAEMKRRGVTLAVNCIGIRAEESPDRAKKNPYQLNRRLSVAGRTVVDFLPIFDLTTDQVFRLIADVGQDPFWTYGAGMSRLSCVFCVFASKRDLTIAARHNPDLYRRYVEAERRYGFTMQQGKTLEETTGIVIDDEDVPEAPLHTVLAFGAGVDSTAILAMHLDRDGAARILGKSREEIDRALPPIDAIAFADPGAEFPETYANVRLAEKRCAAVGLPFSTVVKRDRHGDRLTITAWLERNGTVPLMPGGKHVCSLKFKGEVMQRWASSEFGSSTPVTWIIGIEADEGHRTKRFTPPSDSQHGFAYPLVELGLDRRACVKIIRLLWRSPVRKSSCIFCPYMSENEICTLITDNPDQWAEVREVEARFARTSGEKYGAWIDAGRPMSGSRAPRGMWSRNSWREGARLFAKSVNGRQLSVDEWEARAASAASHSQMDLFRTME